MRQLICEIYEKRPEMCKRYPESGSYVPKQCAFYFVDGERRGNCDPECPAACCMLPRHQGEPTAPAMPEIAGGVPCKHLVYSPVASSSEPSGGVIDEDRQGSGPVETALAEIGLRKGDRWRLE